MNVEMQENKLIVTGMIIDESGICVSGNADELERALESFGAGVYTMILQKEA